MNIKTHIIKQIKRFKKNASEVTGTNAKGKYRLVINELEIILDMLNK